MRILKVFTLGSLLAASSLFADGIGIGIGPLNLELNVGGDGYYVTDRPVVLDNPICHAISHQKRMEMTIENSEKVSSNEMKIITKRVVVEPHAFGITRDGRVVLRGNVIDSKVLKEVKVKYDDEAKIPQDTKEKRSFFSGKYWSEKNQMIDIRKVMNLQVIEDSHFDIPKNYKGLKDDNIHVICELPSSK